MTLDIKKQREIIEANINTIAPEQYPEWLGTLRQAFNDTERQLVLARKTRDDVEKANDRLVVYASKLEVKLKVATEALEWYSRHQYGFDFVDLARKALADIEGEK